MNKKTQSVAIHILGCLAFLSLPIIAYPNFDEFDNPFLDSRFPRVLYKQLLLLAFFYINYYYYLPKFYFKKQYFKLFVIVCASLLLIMFFTERKLPLYQNNKPPTEKPLQEFKKPRNNKPQNGVQLNRTEYTVIQFCFIFIISIFYKNTKRLEELNKQKINSELAYLKAQINPHFLFNTLNSLYALTLEKSDKAPDAVLKLSGLMRYVVNESTQEFVSLEKEINYLNDYIALQKLRMDDKTKFSYKVQGNFSGEYITPLLLIPFVENAFKYGINPEEKGEIDINIQIKNANLELFVSNKIVNKNAIDEDLKSEKGIASSVKRLKFIYANKHTLELTNSNNFFNVLLKIQLK